jgi:hypothetical protein
MTADQIVAAMIGFGAAVVGAVVGGMFALGAGRSQRRGDVRLAREEASRQAAKALIAALFELEGVVVTLMGGGAVAAAEAAATFNRFSGAAIAELPFIDDDQVRSRVNAHLGLGAQLLQAGTAVSLPRNVLDAVRRHADAVTETLEAYIKRAPLPSYQALMLTGEGGIDLDALLKWPGRQ